MTDEHALRRFNKTAEKWRDLAEKRRLYFEELHQSGRWKYYYTEALFYQRLGKMPSWWLWEPVLKARPHRLPPAPKSTAMFQQSPPLRPHPSPHQCSHPRPRPAFTNVPN
jgi:hypothetical protein